MRINITIEENPGSDFPFRAYISDDLEVKSHHMALSDDNLGNLLLNIAVVIKQRSHAKVKA
jgi:hypothetical protein